MRASTPRTICLAAFAMLTALLSWVAAAAGDGGIGTPDPPKVKDVVCSDRCLDVRTVTETGKVEVSGKDLDDTTGVKFPAADGRIEVRPSSVEPGAVTAKVPTGATSGRVVVVTRYGTKAKAPEDLTVKPEDAIKPVKGFAVKRVEADPATAYFDGTKDIELNYLFEADDPADIRIDIVSKDTGKTVDSIIQKDREPFSNQTVAWDGRRTTASTSSASPHSAARAARATLPASPTTTTSSPCAASTPTATASAPAAATRARTSSPSAAPRSSPPAAAKSRSTPTSRPPATTWSSTARRPARTTSTCTWRRRAVRRRARGSRPAR